MIFIHNVRNMFWISVEFRTILENQNIDYIHARRRLKKALWLFTINYIYLKLKQRYFHIVLKLEIK